MACYIGGLKEDMQEKLEINSIWSLNEAVNLAFMGEKQVQSVTYSCHLEILPLMSNLKPDITLVATLHSKSQLKPLTLWTRVLLQIKQTLMLNQHQESVFNAIFIELSALLDTRHI